MRIPSSVRQPGALAGLAARCLVHPAAWWLPFLLLAAVPVWIAWKTACRVPILDAWIIEVRPWLQILEGHSFWGVLHEQCNDSRHDIPRLLHFSVMKFTGGDMRWDALFSTLFGVIAAGLLLPLARHTWPGRPARAWGVALGSAALALSVMHWTNWNWGVQICYTMAVLGTVGVVVVMDSGLPLWGRVWLGGVIALAGTLSFFNGMLAWAAGAFMLLEQQGGPDGNRARMRRAQAVWLVMMLGAAVLFAHGYTRHTTADQVPLTARLLAQPLAFPRYFLEVLGSPVGDVWPRWNPEFRWEVKQVSSLVMAGASLVLAGLLLRGYLRHRGSEKGRAMTAWLALMGLGTGSCLLIAVGRTGLAWSNALEPRYMYFAIWFHIGLFGLLCLTKGRAWAIVRTIWIGIVAFTWTVGSWNGWVELRLDVHRSRLAEAEVIMRSCVPGPSLTSIVPTEAGVGLNPVLEQADAAGLIERRKVTSRRVSDATMSAPGACTGALTRGEVDDDGVLLRGWAMRQDNHDGADGIVISAQSPGQEEVWLGLAQRRLREPKMAKREHASAPEDRIGWAFVREQCTSGGKISGATEPVPLPTGNVTFRAYALDAATTSFTRLEGEVVLDLNSTGPG